MSHVLGGNRQAVARGLGQVAGLGRFLDRDGNGSVLEDIGGMLGNLRG